MFRSKRYIDRVLVLHETIDRVTLSSSIVLRTDT